MSYNHRRLAIICGKGFERVGYGENVGIILETGSEDHHGQTTSAEELPVEHGASFGGDRSVLYIDRWAREHRATGKPRNGVYGKVDYRKIEGILRVSAVTDIVSASTTISYSRSIPEGSLVVPKYFSRNGEVIEFDGELRNLLLEAGGDKVLDSGVYMRYKGSKRPRGQRVLAGSSVPREHALAVGVLNARYACLALVTRNGKNALEKSQADELTRTAAEIMIGFVSRFTGKEAVKQEKDKKL